MRAAFIARHHADAASELGYSHTTRCGGVGASRSASAAPAAWKCTPPLNDSHTSARVHSTGVARVWKLMARGTASNATAAGVVYTKL